MKKLVRYSVVAIVLTMIVFPPRAHAYLDPGTGSFVLQMIAAVFFAGLFLFKGWFGKLKHFFTSLMGRKEKHSSAKSDHE